MTLHPTRAGHQSSSHTQTGRRCARVAPVHQQPQQTYWGRSIQASGHQPAVRSSETLLHDIPAGGGTLLRGDYQNKVAGRLTAQQLLRGASFMGTGFRTIGVSGEDMPRTPASSYGETDMWAKAAHTSGFEVLPG